MTADASITPVKKAVLPVAGFGTRTLPATKVMPKEMLPIVDRPLIQYAIEEAREAGIEEFILVTGRGKDMIAAHFDHQPELMRHLEAKNKDDLFERVTASDIPDGKLSVIRQNRPLGLGHAVYCARNLVGDQPFAVLLPDDLIQAQTGCLRQMMDVYNVTGGNIMAVMEVAREMTPQYGILDIEDDDGSLARVRGLVEKPEPAEAPSTLSVIGRYILHPRIFDKLGLLGRGSGGEIQLTDAIAQLAQDQLCQGMRFRGTRFDCGATEGFVAANMAFGMADAGIGANINKLIQDYAGSEQTIDNTG
jgi:UTP--glucose-1-phosphate uridylyltransferase